MKAILKVFISKIGIFLLFFPPPAITEFHPLVCSPASLEVRVYFMMGRCLYLTVILICLCPAVSSSVVGCALQVGNAILTQGVLTLERRTRVKMYLL